jgi:predicted glutamine amidotransferase
MCRWMAYKGQPIYLEDWILNSEHSLIEQSKSADMTRYEVNGDGFGVGWYGNKPEPGLFKSIRPAWNNSNLKSLAGHVSSPLFLAHVRAASGTPIQETNSHPFQYKNWLMVHNGLIHEFERVEKDLLEKIDAQYFRHIDGSTDSEVLFYLLLSNGLQQDLHLAISKTIYLIDSLAQKHQIKPALRMTLGISDGQSLWAIRYSSNANSATLFYSLEEDEHRHKLLIVSEPLDHCLRCWAPVAENSILQFDKNNKMSIANIDL